MLFGSFPHFLKQFLRDADDEKFVLLFHASSPPYHSCISTIFVVDCPQYLERGEAKEAVRLLVTVERHTVRLSHYN